MGQRTWATQNCSDVLGRFGVKLEVARKKYEQFIEDGLKNSDDLLTTLHVIKRANNEIEDKHDSSCWVIGNHEYVKQVIAQQEQIKKNISRAHRECVSLDSIAMEVCEKLGVKKPDIFRKCRLNKKSQARKLIAYIAYRKYQIPVTAIAQFFDITSSSVSNMLEEGELLYGRLNN
jgi:chromosomal replication initiation ATPase DnaA